MVEGKIEATEYEFDPQGFLMDTNMATHSVLREILKRAGIGGSPEVRCVADKEDKLRRVLYERVTESKCLQKAITDVWLEQQS